MPLEQPMETVKTEAITGPIHPADSRGSITESHAWECRFGRTGDGRHKSKMDCGSFLLSESMADVMLRELIWPLSCVDLE